jgi:hypothetical protein
VSGAATALEFIRAFNERDLDAFVATLHPEVEIHAMRGLRKGPEEAREWATRAPGGVQQRIVVEDVREQDGRVLAVIEREWWWDDPEKELAGVDEMAWLFELRDGLVSSWRAYDHRDEAEAALARSVL